MQAVSLSGLSTDSAEQQKLSAWIQGHNMREDGTKDTFYSVSVDVKRAPMWHHMRGISFTAVFSRIQGLCTLANCVTRANV